jgi:hypothetical protein
MREDRRPVVVGEIASTLRRGARCESELRAGRGDIALRIVRAGDPTPAHERV